MGFGLRFREKVKQVGKKSAQPDKNGFIPTNYERVQLTYDEAVAFAKSLKIIRDRTADAHAARTKMFKEVERTLIGTLPRIHEIDPITGEHHTSEAAPEQQEGDYVHQGTLTRLIEENDIKIQNQVYGPIDKWTSEVDLFKGKMKILENLRLELDGSRRDHITIENKIAKQEAKAAEVDAKHTTHIQSKDASVAGKRTAYEQYEAQVYEELVTLIGDSGMLHTVLDRLCKLEIEVYQKVQDPISTTTARLEQLSSSGGSGLNTPVSSTQFSPHGTGVGQGISPSYGSGAPVGGSTLPNVPSYGSGAPVGGSSLPNVPSYGSGGPVGTGHASTTAPTSGAIPNIGSGGGQGVNVNYQQPGSNVAYERPYAS